VCGLTPTVDMRCSVRIDDVTQTKVYENIQCSGKLIQRALTENYEIFGLKNTT